MPFVEHDVPGDANALCRKVKDAIGLDALCVADEDPQRALVVELADMVELLGEHEAAEDTVVADHQFVPVPCLVWHLAIKGLGGRAVEEMDGSHHRLPLVNCRHPSLLEEGAGGGHHRLVAALNDTVLLRCVWCREVALDLLIGAVRHELTAVVGVGDHDA